MSMDPRQEIQKGMLKNTKAVLFDLDGTLVDSMWIWKEIDIDYLGRRGLPMPDDLQKRIEGMSMKETAVYFKETFALPDSTEQMMEEWIRMAYLAYETRVFYKNGAEDFLRFLKRSGIKTGICTSNAQDLLQAVAGKLGMDRYIDCFLTANEVDRGKPFPDIYLEMAKRLCVEPRHCLVFEDILPGIQAGRAAGMNVCAVYDDYSANVTEEKKKAADYYIEDYTKLAW